MNLFFYIINYCCKLFCIQYRLLILQKNNGNEKTNFSSPTICFAITVCDEHEELQNVLDAIIPYLGENDEILIQGDEGKVTDKVKFVIEKYSSAIKKYVEFPLNRDFGAFKNNIFAHTEKQYIFQLDADEIPSPYLMKNLNEIIAHNPDIELLKIPRLNTIINDDENLTTWENVNTIKKEELINFPDYQRRIYKNIKSIKWTKKLHEKIVGNKSSAYLPKKQEYCILHCKRRKKQLKWVAYFAEEKRQ